MNTTVYVDVLLVTNYIINLLLIQCTAKFSGVKPKRRKIVAAALFASLCSLTIFLPFMGFFAEFLMKLLLSAAIVRLAMPWRGKGFFFRQWFVFFAVNFCLAGAMLALWMLASPTWLTYYNGIIYLHVSSFVLLATTIAAYLLLTVLNKLLRIGRLSGSLCRVQIYRGGKMCSVTGLVDTGNSLTEPFSGLPVMVCGLRDVEALFDEGTIALLRAGIAEQEKLLAQQFRLVPYSAVGGVGMLPAFQPDKLVIREDTGTRQVSDIYVAVSAKAIGDSRYTAILNPEMTAYTHAGSVRG